MKIPCETIARLSNLIDPEAESPFNAFRLDNGKVIATDRKFMAIEYVGGWTGVYYLAADSVLIEQCKTEAKFAGSVEIAPVDALQFTTVKTTLGFAPQGNMGVWPVGANTFDQWHDLIVKPCIEPVVEPRGGMIWRTEAVIRLAQSSPSGQIVFEERIDCETRPTVVRDINSADWCGFFLPRLHDGAYHAAATLPGWLK